MTALFVTATGTEVGKTFVTAAIAHWLTKAGRTVHTLKPVISGFNVTTAMDSDTHVLIRASGLEPTDDLVAETSPWRFEAPLAPEMAARREDRAIRFDEVVSFCRVGMSGPEDVCLIEGVGGAFAPVAEGHLNADWIAALGIPALVVAGSYLGTIGHTVATVEALRSRGIHLSGIVISQSLVEPVPLAETCQEICALIPDLSVVGLPRFPADRGWREAGELLAEFIPAA